MSKFIRFTSLAFASFALPAFAFAHEVYVLPLDVIREAMTNPSPDPFTAMVGNEMKFFFWAFVGFVVVSTIAAATFFGLPFRGSW